LSSKGQKTFYNYFTSKTYTVYLTGLQCNHQIQILRRSKMSKFISLFEKFTLAALVLAIGLTAIPVISASAAGFDNSTALPGNQIVDNTHLELNWARVQNAYKRQGDRLDIADKFIARAQSLIDKATGKGWDTSAVQAALDAFTAVIPAAQSVHNKGGAIITSHNGFDASGKVTDRTAAITTVKALSQVLKDTRATMDGTGKALRDALKAFRDAHRPTP
jgi:hypothetical protein